jgi:cyclopropane-fatty-acyl-phospholipid synthase
MPSLKEKLCALLHSAGIQVNGDNPWDIQVHDDCWYGRALKNKNLGLGESYMEGWWDCQQLDVFFDRLIRAQLCGKLRIGLSERLRLLPGLLCNLQKCSRARIIADRHYNLGNDLFAAFLDPNWQYSCGYFQRTDSLEQAQEDKLAMICGKLELKESDHLLDIGCGWGGLARYAASHYGCRVTAVNISQPQLEFAREFCQGLSVEFIEEDYRSLSGSYDKIVSVGMFEHVGWRNYRTFMQVVHRCLKPDGLCLLHTIGGDTSKTSADPWISKYIFPNGMLPSIAQISKACETLMTIEDVHNIGSHYDPTLMAWNERFQKSWDQLKVTYDMRFKRMWEYYLLSCAGGFRSRNIHLWQILMSRFGSGRASPECRPYGL